MAICAKQNVILQNRLRDCMGYYGYYDLGVRSAAAPLRCCHLIFHWPWHIYRITYLVILYDPQLLKGR